MKKFALFFCFSAFMLSQVTAQTGLRLGVQASPSWAWLRTNDKKIEGVGSNWGIKLGFVGDYFFTNKYAVTTGIGFGFNHGGSVQNGYSRIKPWTDSDLASIPSDTFSTDAKFHYRINYVEIPLGLKLRGGSNEDSRFRFYAEGGLNLGFVSKATGDVRGTNTQNIKEVNIRDEVKGLSLSWNLGGGIEYEIASTTLVGGLSFQKQFTDMTQNGFVEKTAGNWQKESSKASFGMIALRLGVFF